MSAELSSSVTQDLATVLQRLADGIIITDALTHSLVFVNEKGARFAGFDSAAQMMAAGSTERRDRVRFFDERGQPLPRERLIYRVAALGETPPPTLVQVRAAGIHREHWCEMTAIPLLDEAGRPRQVVTVFRDVTAQRRAQRTLRFMAEATAVLSASLDYPTTLQSLVRLVVPELADGCTVDVLEDGEPHRVMAHADPARDELWHELRRRYPMKGDAPGGPAAVMRTGQPYLLRTPTDEALRPLMHDEEHLRLFKRLGYREVLVVPLAARGRVLGALSLVLTEPGRSFEEADQALAAELANRAALAIDNARLYREAQAAARRKDEESQASEALRRVGASMASELDPAKLVQIITDEATAMVGAEYGAFFQSVPKDGGEAHRLFALSGAAREAFVRLPRPEDTPLFHSTWRGERVIRCDDVREDPRYGRSERYLGLPPEHPKVTSYLAVPVLSRSGEVFGALLFGHPERGVFTERHERLAATLADHATLALENARLFQRARDAEAHSRVSEERLRMALDAGRMGHFDVELDSGRADVSPFVERLLGYGPGGFNNHRSGFITRVHPEDLPPLKACLEALVREGTRQVLEYRVRWPDGTVRWVESHTRVMRDEAGRAVRQVGVMLDSTERHEAEAQSRKLAAEQAARAEAEASEHRISAILESIGEPVFALDAEGRVRFLNAQAARLFGRPREEALGRGALELFPTPEAREFLERCQRELALRPVMELEERLKDGTWMELRVCAFDGGMAVFMRDITARKRDMELEARRAQYEALRADVGTALASAEPLGAVLQRCAEAMALHLGAGAVAIWTLESDGKTLLRQGRAGAARVIPGRERVPVDQPAMRVVLESRRPHVLNDLTRSKTFDSQGWAQENGLTALAGFPLLLGESPVGVVAIFSAHPFPEQLQPVLVGIADTLAHGIERKRAELALAQRAAELARSNDDLEKFAYVASHDLKEPLRMVATYTQLLARRYRGRLDQDADEFIHFAVDGARRMQALINDLLTYSRVGTQRKELAPIRAGAVLERALANLQAAIEENDAEVIAQSLPEVMGDEVQLEQLFQNLVGNALKFHGEEKPRVEISARPEGAEWRFSVRDNGIGIDPEHFERIFVIFQRLHGRERYDGTGIGLAVCKKIVERHGGRIWVESTPGQGATFHFTLPAPG